MAISAYRGFLFLVESDGKSQAKAKLAKTGRKCVYKSTEEIDRVSQICKTKSQKTRKNPQKTENS